MNRIRTEEILHEANEQESSPDPTNPRTRIVGMRWVKLGEGKDPEFGVTLFLCRIDPDNHCYFKSGFLKAIEIEQNNKVFKFVIDYEGADSIEVISTTFTYYCNPSVPK